MWLWRLCSESVEDMLTILKHLRQFKNRQVVINFYDDEELIKRDGFYFGEIDSKGSNLVFKNDSNLLCSLDLSKYFHFKISGDFKDYFVLSRGKRWVELYFP